MSGGGFGKPPKKNQFKKGQSGNPKGRPKGSKNLKTDALNALNIPVPLTTNGKTKKISSQLAALLRLREKALNGNLRALEKFLELAARYNDDELYVATEHTIQKSDADIIAEFMKRKDIIPPTDSSDKNEGDPEDDEKDGGDDEPDS